MCVYAEIDDMQFPRMRKQHRYALHLLHVSLNLFCANVV